MDKQAAIKAFGSGAELARAVGVTHSAVTQWPDPLPRYAADKVLAALLRLGRMPPPELMPAPERAA